MTTGDLLLALSLNPLFVLFVCFVALQVAIGSIRPGLAAQITVPARVERVIPFAVVLFWIGRNL